MVYLTHAEFSLFLLDGILRGIINVITIIMRFIASDCSLICYIPMGVGVGGGGLKECRYTKLFHLHFKPTYFVLMCY